MQAAQCRSFLIVELVIWYVDYYTFYHPVSRYIASARPPRRMIGSVNRERRTTIARLRETEYIMTTFSTRPTTVARKSANTAPPGEIRPLETCVPTRTAEEAALAVAPTTTTTRNPIDQNKSSPIPLKTLNEKNNTASGIQSEGPVETSN